MIYVHAWRLEQNIELSRSDNPHGYSRSYISLKHSEIDGLIEALTRAKEFIEPVEHRNYISFGSDGSTHSTGGI